MRFIVQENVAELLGKSFKRYEFESTDFYFMQICRFFIHLCCCEVVSHAVCGKGAVSTSE